MSMAIIFLLGVVCCYGAGIVREELAMQKLAKAATRQHLLDLEEAYDRRVSLPVPMASPGDTATVAYAIAQREASLRVPAEMVFLSLSTEIAEPLFGSCPPLIDDGIGVIRRDYGKN
jgi:hypothetical protein